MSPESIIAALARLNALLQERYELQQAKLKKFKQKQLMLAILSVSVAFVMFYRYEAPVTQMLFILFGFNLLFYIGFKPRSIYREKWVKQMMQQVLALQVKLKKFLMQEEVDFEGVRCSINEGWICDKWGLYREDERIDYAEFLHDKAIKGLYLEALRNKK